MFLNVHLFLRTDCQCMNLMHLLPLDLLWLEGNSCFVMLSYSLNLFYLVKCTNATQVH